MTAPLSPKDQTELTEDELGMLEAFRSGWPILHRSTVGHMVRITLGAEAPDGPRILIEVPLDPRPIKGEHEARYVEQALAAWGRRLAEWRVRETRH